MMDNAHGPQGSARPEPDEPQQPEQSQAVQASGPTQAMQPPVRVPSGVSGLDTLMQGGFLRGGIYIISGQPGTGKTILSNQIAFNHAASGGRVVYVSLLSENPAHLFSHLSSLSFFHFGPIGHELYYVSGYGTLEREGLKGLATLLRGLILDHKATLLVVDGALNAEQAGSSELEFKAFTRQLQVFGETAGCTILLLVSTGGGAAGAEGEATTLQVAGKTTVDGLVQLGYRRIEMRLVREIEVRKLRGSAHILGGNAMDITGDGIQVYPRLEAMLARSVAAKGTSGASPMTRGPIISGERMAFGLPRLDQMLQGGAPEGSSTVLLGPTGSGKTLVGLSFLIEGARHEQSGLYFGLNEPLTVVMAAASSIGLDLAGPLNRRTLETMWQLPVESIVDQIAGDLLDAVRSRQVKRLFIDSLDTFSRAIIFPARTARFFTSLLNELRFLGVTTLSALELPDLFSPSVALPIQGISAAAENTIFMRNVELNSQLHRLISVLKLQRSGYDPGIREFTISDEGIEVRDVFKGTEGILTGLARPLRITQDESS